MSYSDDGGAIGRAQIGYLWAVLIPASLVATVMAVLYSPAADVLLEAQMFIVSFLVAAIVIGVAAALIGLPLTWLLARHGLERPIVYPAAGFLAGGAIAASLVRFGVPYEAELTEFLPFALLGGLPGCLCGQVWWWFNRRHAQTPE
jgi:hypothetical protein